jgi:hypothetical protein
MFFDFMFKPSHLAPERMWDVSPPMPRLISHQMERWNIKLKRRIELRPRSRIEEDRERRARGPYRATLWPPVKFRPGHRIKMYRGDIRK